jgi:imidazoleglycerol-phosphate dehydratase
MDVRRATIERKTKETDIVVDLTIDGRGSSEITTGIGFLDHMLDLLARHGGFDLVVKARGDLDVDQHHTVEDIGLALGQALREALGDKRGVRRFGHAVVPMDEALAMIAVDLSGRPFLHYDLDLTGVRIGEFDADLAGHFFQSVVNQGQITMHVRLLSGSDPHHIVEAVFKGVARALAGACGRTGDDAIPSTKGTL